MFLQECFNSPYGTGFFAEYAEKIPGESTEVLSEAAKECGVYLVGGETLRRKPAHVCMVDAIHFHGPYMIVSVL